ncbi:MAG: deoxyribonuclease V [Chloroflexota bacterium]|nr:deoxyribonuclease V [Chloroflexota bacterium]
MKLAAAYPWPGDLEEAAALQRRLAGLVSTVNETAQPLRYVAGVDISAPDDQGWVRGAIVVLRWPELTLAEVRIGRAQPPVPYIPGYLAFREVPAAEDALERLEITPDVILVDGQGMAHPRRFGVACHLGLTSSVPTIGCAKSRLTGRWEGLGDERASSAPLVDRGEVIGAAVRTRTGVSPVYVSVGHRIDLETAIAVTLGCCRKHRLPEPTRLAHLAAAGRYAEGVYPAEALQGALLPGPGAGQAA